MYTGRVNLLRKNELRYQGAVSRRFIMVSMVVAPILLIAVLSGIKMLQYSGVQADLKASREIWKELEPRLSLYMEERRGLATNQQVIDFFDGWKQSKASFVQLLDGVQDTMPANIQLVRLSVRTPLKTDSYATPKELELDYNLTIEGLSEGGSAETAVIQLRKDLEESPRMSQAFDAIKLVSMRKRDGVANVNLREFRLEGEQLEGGAQ